MNNLNEWNGFDIINYIPKGKRLITAGKSKSGSSNKPLGLVFLVDDVENPQIPGDPAICIGGNHDVQECEKFIKDTYQRLNFKPKFN